MSCNRLYGGQKKNKQASLRKRSGGNPVGDEGDSEVKPTDGQNPVNPGASATTGDSATTGANSNEKVDVPTVIKRSEEVVGPLVEPKKESSVINKLWSVFNFDTKKPVEGSSNTASTGGKRRTQRKQQNQRKTHKAGGQKTLIGGIFSKTCVHCVAMQGEWKKLQKMLKQHGGNILMKNVEAEKMDQQLPQVNKQFLGGSDQRVEMQGGFPTLFKIKNKKVEYYGGERTADAMLNWALQ